MQRYQKLQDELKTQPEDVLLKLKTLRTEAENLLNKANGSKRKLEGRDAPWVRGQNHAAGQPG